MNNANFLRIRHSALNGHLSLLTDCSMLIPAEGPQDKLGSSKCYINL